ncbi:MAG: hypothetical protein R8M37_02075 [Alphaproteobacteria bacterium]|nr:hypothetical protein [Alphaproteobacteria bacterium]
MKKMAGINTAVTAVGTAAGVGATVVGFIKADKDERIEKLEMERLQKISDSNINSGVTNGKTTDNLAALETYYQNHKNDSQTDIDTEIDRLTNQSKNLGNWRTGLLAGSTATNVASAIISGTNKVDDDLKSQIDNCVASVSALERAIMQARMDGIDVAEGESIAAACGEFEYVDVSQINNRAQGAFISSLMGTATGLAGTVTSAIANTDKTRNDNTESGKQKEKNLNTAANVLSIGTTLASGTATVFNATQISAIKKVATVAEKCTGVLK